MRWRRWARSWSLILFGALASYLITTALFSQVAIWAANQTSFVTSPLLRALIGVLTLDVTKLAGLLPAAWLLRSRIELPPLVAAAGMVLLFFGLEFLVTQSIGADDLRAWRPMMWGTRFAVAALLTWPLVCLLRRRQPWPERSSRDT